MNTNTDNKTLEDHPRHRPGGLRRWILGLLTAGTALALVVGVAGFAGGPRGHFGMGHRNVDPEDARAHMEFMVGRALSKVDATEDQKTQIQAILDEQLVKMLAMRGEHDSMREEMHALLTADTIDRQALERFRAQQLERAQAVSLEITDSVARVAEVLTPAQRRELVQWMESQHDR
ncbi:MAG: Spy/CpxP family protein refolding chaperone [Pseudomonadota bacterium]